MRKAHRPCLAALAVLGLCSAVTAQQTSPGSAGSAVPPPAPPPATAPLPPVAATVNEQPIPEVAVQRGLKRVPPARRDEARPEILNFLIDNALVDQYLARQALTVDQKEVDAKVQQVHEAIQKDGNTVEKVLRELM